MYIKPECGEVNFIFGGSYFPPNCGIINYSFGIDGDVGIIPSSSEIRIEAGSMMFFSGVMIIPESSEIRIQSETSLLDILIPIGIESSEIIIEAPKMYLEILPDMSIATSEIRISSTIGKIRKTYDFNLPSGKSPAGQGCGWSDGIGIDNSKKFPWGVGEELKTRVANPQNIPKHIDNDVDSKWKYLDKKDVHTSTTNNVFDVFDHVTMSVWTSKMVILDHQKVAPVAGGQVEIDCQITVPYLTPGAKDSLKSVRWNKSDQFDHHVETPWLTPGAKDTSKVAAWGPFSYYTLCSNTNYYPPDACEIKFNFPNKYQLVKNVCEGIVFHVNEYSTDVRCPYDHWHAGTRDVGSGIIPVITSRLTYPIGKEVNYMLNSVMVSDVYTGTAIEILHVDAKIDRDSWLWSFNVTVASKCFLDIIKPENGLMGQIKIDMNGYVWYCTVEGWSENRSFGSQAWTITGRSPSMMFGSPISEAKSFIIDDPKQGQQIIEDIVTTKQIPSLWPSVFENWGIDFSEFNDVYTGFLSYANWYIPGGTVSYSNSSEIDIIKNMTSAIGGYVQTEPDTNMLTVKPMFKEQPWNWNVANSNIEWITMSESQIIEVSRSNELISSYDAVHVIGESAGGNADGTSSDGTNTAIHIEIKRDGSDGVYAPMVTDSYITSSKVALEKGRTVIAQTGEWIKHTLRIGILCPDGGSSFQLFKTGDMISVSERGVPWFGQVTGVSIVAANAGAGFAIEQLIEVEEYNGD